MAFNRQDDQKIQECKDKVFFAQAEAKERCRMAGVHHSGSFLFLMGSGFGDLKTQSTHHEYLCNQAVEDAIKVINECQKKLFK